MSASKHTEGKARIGTIYNPSPSKIIDPNFKQPFINVDADGIHCIAQCSGPDREANAARIIEMWNNWDEVMNLMALAKSDLQYLLKEVKEIIPGSYRASDTIEKMQALLTKHKTEPQR